MGTLYDRADIYDLFDNEEKFLNVKKHWAAVLEGKKVESLLDVSIGTGSLTMPLCDLGVKVSGSDLSEAMLSQCSKKAKARGYEIDLKQSDFRKVDEAFDTTFDCVASTGNSLPYVTNEEIPLVLSKMDQLVAKGGYLYYDMRNWDKILGEKNRFYLYHPQFVNGTRVNLIQVWDYNPDQTMTFNLLFTFEENNKIIQKEKFEEHYYPVSMELMLEELTKLGYGKIQILCHPAFYKEADPKEADWYCVIAQKL